MADKVTVIFTPVENRVHFRDMRLNAGGREIWFPILSPDVIPIVDSIQEVLQANKIAHRVITAQEASTTRDGIQYLVTFAPTTANI